MKYVFGICNKKSIPRRVHFPFLVNALHPVKKDWNNETWVDSGGFQILMHNVNVNLKDIYNFYKKYDANYYFSLDVPPKFCEPEPRETLENFEFLYTHLDKTIIPVVHASDPQNLYEQIDFYKQYTGYIALGGTVFLAKNLMYYELAHWVYFMRKNWSGYFHVLGVTSPKLKAIVSIADSVDSSASCNPLRYAKVLMPDGSERALPTLKKPTDRKILSKKELQIIKEFLRKTGFPYKIDLLNPKSLIAMQMWIIAYSPINPKLKQTVIANEVYKKTVTEVQLEMEEICKNWKNSTPKKLR